MAAFAEVPHPAMPCIVCEHRAAYHQTAAPVGERECVHPGCPCADWVEWVGVPWLSPGASAGQPITGSPAPVDPQGS